MSIFLIEHILNLENLDFPKENKAFTLKGAKHKCENVALERKTTAHTLHVYALP